MATTLKDVAREANVAVETVSRVLNNRGYISEKTRKKVNDAMEKLGYRPNTVARTLSKGRADAIGVIVPHIVHPYFAQMISEIERVAAGKNLSVFISSSAGNNEREKQILELCENSQLAGVLLFSSNVRPEQVKAINIPVVTIERFIEGGTSCVLCDNYSGGSIAAEHLIKKGCKHLIMLGSVDRNAMPADEREDGFRDVCSANGVSVNIIHNGIESFRNMEYHKYIEEALRENPDTDGIFCSSDIIAAQAIQVCKKLGLDVPGRIKIIGFDDTMIAGNTTPMITTIHQPITEMAELGVDMILRENNGQVVPEKNILKVSLVERETT